MGPCEWASKDGCDLDTMTKGHPCGQKHMSKGMQTGMLGGV